LVCSESEVSSTRICSLSGSTSTTLSTGSAVVSSIALTTVLIGTSSNVHDESVVASADDCEPSCHIVSTSPPRGAGSHAAACTSCQVDSSVSGAWQRRSSNVTSWKFMYRLYANVAITAISTKP